MAAPQRAGIGGFGSRDQVAPVHPQTALVGFGHTMPNITSWRLRCGSQTAPASDVGGGPDAGSLVQVPFVIDHASANGSPRFPGPAPARSPSPPKTRRERSSGLQITAASARPGGVGSMSTRFHAEPSNAQTSPKYWRFPRSEERR